MRMESSTETVKAIYGSSSPNDWLAHVTGANADSPLKLARIQNLWRPLSAL
jgi:hypothetical protein